jgi:hypothetical protein
MVTLSDTIVKRFGSKGTRGDEEVPSAVSTTLQDPPARADVSRGPATGAVDVALSGRVGVVDRGNVYGLVASCLQDVHFTALCTLAFADVFLTLSCF